MTESEQAELEAFNLEIRSDIRLLFEEFLYFQDEKTRQPTRGPANILQARIFEHYKRCQAEDKPCRIVILKYRRAGSSTASAALIYTHAHNYNARLGVIGTDYRASSNMLTMLSFFGKHDEFPGWTAKTAETGAQTIPWQDYDASKPIDSIPWEERVSKTIATKIEWTHGSAAELYTASNPESARSAGLNGFHATEVGRWPSGGQRDAMETLSSMRNTLPKSGFHLAIEESTANGAQGAFYDTCRTARWPDYAAWPEMHKSCWPLADSEYGKDLQFVFIFSAWFEDARHIERETPEAVLREDPLSAANAATIAKKRNAERDRKVEATIDAEPWYFGEKELIAKYAQDGPRGQRLGAEVDATIWEQLAWRRGIIKNVCTRRGLDEFCQEYPSNPLEAFRASGAPVLDFEGIMALDEALRKAKAPEVGVIDQMPSGSIGFRRTPEAESLIQIWEHPIPSARYLMVVDPTKSAEIVKDTGERDRNSVLVLRDACQIGELHYPVKVVARIKPPNQWQDATLARLCFLLSSIYGRCIIVVESNLGSGLITRLRDRYRCRLYAQENWDVIRQKPHTTYGWNMNEETRRLAVSTLQEFAHEQRVEILCPNIIAELKTFVFNSKGRAEAASGAHDDDVMALAIGLCCLVHATTAAAPEPLSSLPVDHAQWKGEDEMHDGF